ncbi:hypothetical protein BYT27DRAFT_7264937 [Phlegmacium glaucopus]|nr:hypothetical protein BYT27DRAFT_7264937 [Phlegmacium glaucopus]
MVSMLHDFVLCYPAVTLAYAQYGQDFHFGNASQLLSSPMQHFQSSVESDGSAYHFIVIGQLTGFKVMDDSFGRCLSLNIG